MANEITPSAWGNITPEMFEREIQLGVSEAMRIAPFFKRGGKSGEQVHVRKLAAPALTSPANTAALKANDLTLADPADTEITPSPVTSYVAWFLQDNTRVRMVIQDPTDQLRQLANEVVAEGIDIECAKLADDLTAIGGVGQDVTEAEFLVGRDDIAAAAKGHDTGRRVFCFAHQQGKHVIVSTQNWSQYQIRGDQDNPVATGELKNVYGYKFIETGNIQNIGALFHNPMFIDQMTFMIGYNQDPTGEVQRNGMGHIIMVWSDFWVGTVWSDRGRDFNTKVT